MFFIIGPYHFPVNILKMVSPVVFTTKELKDNETNV